MPKTASQASSQNAGPCSYKLWHCLLQKFIAQQYDRESQPTCQAPDFQGAIPKGRHALVR